MEVLEPRLLLSASLESQLYSPLVSEVSQSMYAIPSSIEVDLSEIAATSQVSSVATEDFRGAAEEGDAHSDDQGAGSSLETLAVLQLPKIAPEENDANSLSPGIQAEQNEPATGELCVALECLQVGPAEAWEDGQNEESDGPICWDSPVESRSTEELVATLHAANPPPQEASILFADTTDKAADLGPVIEEAIRQWSNLPTAEGLQTQLEQVKIGVADLPEGVLAQTTGYTILLDVSAAGHSWFIDTTPSCNEEFTFDANLGRWVADPTGPAYGRVDLLTTLLHEIGHVLGLDHDADLAVMTETLGSGQRALPGDSGRSSLLRVSDPVHGNLTFDSNTLTLDASAETGPITFRIFDSDSDATADDVEVTGAASGNGVYVNVGTIVGGSGDDKLTGPDIASAWQLTGADAGSVNDLAFSGIESITGGNDADEVWVSESGSLTGTIDGGAGEDLLVGPNVASSWQVNAADAGTLNWETTVDQSTLSISLGFRDIENLAGGSNADAFKVGQSGSLTGVLDGGTGMDRLDYSAWTSGVIVNLSMGIAPSTFRITGIENVTGSSRDDILIGDDNANQLIGGGGNDILVGEAGDDILTGGIGNDTYLLTPGDTDTITELAGQGTDTLDYSAYLADSPVTVDLTGDTATGTNGVANIESVVGGSGDDILTGDANANSLTGGAGNDVLSGGGGNDALTGGAGDDTYVFAVAGGTNTITIAELEDEGIDTLDYSAYPIQIAVAVDLAAGTATGTSGVANIEDVIGGSGNDSLTGNEGANRLAGGRGNDTLTGGAGDDTYVLNPDGIDTIIETGGGIDTLDYSAFTTPVVVSLAVSTAPGTNGISSIENLVGGSADDTLTGDAKANRLDGGPGSDTLTGGPGDDTYVLNPNGIDTIIEMGGGSDTLDYSAFTTGVTVSLAEPAAPGTYGVSGIENLLGSSGDDSLTGDAGANRLMGGPGNDTLAGGGGDDTYVLTPDGGADTITESAGEGTDTIVGPDVDTDWIITDADYDLDGDGTQDLFLGSDSGVITGGTTFVGIEHVIGGNADDNFKFEGGGSISGSIQGGGQVDGDAIIGAARINIWNITGPNSGTLNGYNFSGIENLIGGNTNDTFLFSAVGSISGIVSGGPDCGADYSQEDYDQGEVQGIVLGVDTIDYSALLEPLTVDLEEGTVMAGTTPLVGGHDAIDAFIGSAGSDTVIGYDLAELFWTITGPDEFTVAAISFRGFENLTGQDDNIDGFIVEALGSLSGLIDGGTGGTDGLFITTTFGIGMVVDIDDTNGSGTTDPTVYGKAVQYENFEPQQFAFYGDLQNVVIAGSIFDDTIRVYGIDLDGDGIKEAVRIERSSSTYTIDEIQLALLTSLRIEGRAGTDTINVESLPANFGGSDGADLMICGSHMPVFESVAQMPADDPFIDRVNFTGSIDLKDGCLDVWADRITVADNVVIQTTSDITFRPRLMGIAELENLIPLGFATDRKVSITIGQNARLMGAEISLFAQAEDKSIADTAGAPKEVENFVIEPLMGQLADLIALPVKVLVKSCTATITLRQGAQLIATGPIGIYATAAADASGIAKGNLISVGYAQAKAYADIIIETGVVIQAAEAIVITSTGESKAGMKVDTKHKIDSLPKPSGTPFAIALGVSYANSSSHVTMAQGASITSGRTVNLTAKGKIESEAEAESGLFADGSLGLAFALEFSKADIDTTVDGTIIAECDSVGGYAVKLEIDPTVGLNPDGTPQIGYVDYAHDRIYVGPNALITEDTVTYTNRRGVSIGNLVNGREYYIVTDGDGWIQLAESEINAIRADLGEKQWLVDLKDKSGSELETANNQKSFTGVQVNSADDTITLERDDPVFNTFELGQAVVFKAGTGCSIGGLIPGNTYYIITSTTEQDIQGDSRFASKQIIRL
ncbi:MAG: hypothetical protein JW828_15350, partial [Sedimentisphaerales bacterium]|nr:hypothetical protein [Sedimentisphaerales bacterium]